MNSIDLSTMSELTTRQAATLLNVSVRTVQLWVERGVLQAWKTAGGHRRISVSSIQQLLDEKMEKQISGNFFSRPLLRHLYAASILVSE